MNVLEITNEFLILMCTYNLFVYSDGMLLTKSPLYPEVQELIKDQEMTYNVGWAHVALLGALILINFAVMIVVQVKTIKRKCKLCNLKRSHKKRMKEYEARRKLHDKLKDMIKNPEGQNAAILESKEAQALDSNLVLKAKTKKLLKGSKKKKILTQTRTNDLNAIPEASQEQEAGSE